MTDPGPADEDRYLGEDEDGDEGEEDGGFWSLYDAAVDRVGQAERSLALANTRRKAAKEELEMALHALRRLRSQRDAGGPLEQLALPGAVDEDAREEGANEEDGEALPFTDVEEAEADEDGGEEDEDEPGQGASEEGGEDAADLTYEVDELAAPEPDETTEPQARGRHRGRPSRR